MSQIPSDIAASAAQAGFVAKEVSKDREARGAGQAHAAEKQVNSLNELDEIVETNDNDTQVFADAEGSGSEGREGEEESSTSEEPAAGKQEGFRRDDEGRLRVDLEA